MAELDQVHEGLREIDIAVHNLWTLGKNMIVGWTPDEEGIQVCFAPVYSVLGQAGAHPHLVDGSRRMDAAAFAAACKLLRTRPLRLPLPFKVRAPGSPRGVAPEAIDSVIRRYSIVRTAHRAVMLFDIVGFATATPIEQLARFTSLESSISSAGQLMCDAGLEVELARSTAGDGFIFVWNRGSGLEADLRTYASLVLTLFDNALARQAAGPDNPLVPTLRTSFTVGSHYSYHQIEGTRPRSFEYATGQVTITLARILEKSLPGQILVGDFQRPAGGPLEAGLLDSVMFLARADASLARLAGTKIDEHTIGEIRSLVSGGKLGTKAHSVLKYAVTDKHGNGYGAFNLEIKIGRKETPAVNLGLRPADLSAFDAQPEVYEIPIAAAGKPDAARSRADQPA